MSRSRWFLAALAAFGALSLTCASELDAAPASLLGLRLSATTGPVYAPGPNSADLGTALGVQFEASRAAGPRMEWFGAVAYHDFNDFASPLIDWGIPPGLFVPPIPLSGEDFRSYGFELGLRRRIAAGALDLFVEGAAGIARTDQPSEGTGPFNDRRPDPVTEPLRFSPGGTGASFSLGAGGVIARNGRVGLVTAVSARWLSAYGVAGPIVPMRLGLAWPVEPAPARAAAGEAAAAPNPRAPRLRLGLGTAWLDTPADVWRASHPALGVSAGVEVPIGRWPGLAWRLDGAQALFVSSGRAVLWQEPTASGSFRNVYSSGAAHWTATFLTTGLSASRPFGRVTPYLHAGAGLGRTGGDGSTINTVAYVPPGDPSLTPLYLTGAQGFGRPHTGVAWTGGAGLEYAVSPAWSAYVEGTMLGVNLDSPDVQVLAMRAGVVLR